jgi:hypothetical protein
MARRKKIALLFILALVGFALIFSGQARAQSFDRVYFDNGGIEVIFNATGLFQTACFYDPAGSSAAPCSADYVEGSLTMLYVCKDDASESSLQAAGCQLLTNVGPGTGCACYSNPRCVTVGGVRRCY